MKPASIGDMTTPAWGSKAAPNTLNFNQVEPQNNAETPSQWPTYIRRKYPNVSNIIVNWLGTKMEPLKMNIAEVGAPHRTPGIPPGLRGPRAPWGTAWVPKLINKSIN